MIPLGFEHRVRPHAAAVWVARLAELGPADAAAWSALTRAASADNPFASDYFTRAVLTHFDPGARARLFIVTGDDGAWIGALAAEPAAHFGRMPMPHWRGLLNANQFVGGPLVRRGQERAFWAALLPALDPMAGAALALPMLAEDDRVTQALIEHCVDTGRAVRVTRRIQRAMMRPASAAMPLSPKRRARLAVLERRLAADHGPVRSNMVMAEQADRWIADFLALEAAGWKGKAGTALACRRDSADLFTDIMRAGLTAGTMTAQTLLVGDRAVAMSAYFLAGGRGFGFKCCYDELYAAYAPGILLLQDIARQPATAKAQLFDSCSAPDEATINGLWPQRRAMIDLCIATGPRRAWRFRTAMGARTLWHRLKGSA
jgi:CelD/BcsL family acetyltransferase involved in cellulose biosynthesis